MNGTVCEVCSCPATNKARLEVPGQGVQTLNVCSDCYRESLTLVEDPEKDKDLGA